MREVIMKKSKNHKSILRCAGAAIFTLSIMSLVAGCSKSTETPLPSNEPATTNTTSQIQESGKTMTEQQDPFIWLEEVEGEKPLNWVRAQNKRSLAELKGDPRFEGFYQDALKIVNSDDRIAAPSIVGDKVRNFWQDADHVRGIWREASLSSYLSGKPEWETILDIDALAKEENENWVYQGSDCLAPDNMKCILFLSRGGSDANVSREFSIAERAFVKDGFQLPEMKGAINWIDADTVVVGGDIGDDGLTSSGYPNVVRLWKRGTDILDSKVIYKGKVTDVNSVGGSGIKDGKTYSFITRSYSFFEREFFLFDKEGNVSPMNLPAKSFIVGIVNDAYVVSLQENWSPENSDVLYNSGDLVSVRYDGPTMAESQLVFSPNDRQAVNSVRISKNTVLIQVLDNIIGQVLKMEYRDGEWQASKVDLPGEGVVSLGSVNAEGDNFFLYFDSPVQPDTLYYLSEDGKRSRIKQSPSFFNAAGVVTRQYEATSKDGTKIPYFVIGREAVMDAGNAVTLQYGYGGFDIPITPVYSGVRGKIWFENNGLYVIANIRGGGEFGPKWHQAALKENRQRAYDDFFAVSEDLIAKGITNPKKLGILGGSNGGLLMGVAMTQRPDLYNAIGIGVPLLDMLRYHKLLAGASWIGEYGDPDIPEERAFISQYSPYQNLKSDGDYPRVYFFTSTKDDRVHPGHARKMAAKMEKNGQPFLYYENIEGGHGAAANLKQRAYNVALQYVYFLRQLEDKDQ